MKDGKDAQLQPKNLFVLLGDSHTRSYKLSNYLATRIFLAQGRKNNFKNNLHSVLTTLRYIRVARKFHNSGLELAFVIGEPDVRWLAYGQWDLGRSESDVLNSDLKQDVDELQLQSLLTRLKIFLFITKSINLCPKVVIGSGSPNPEMFQPSLKFNGRLSELCNHYGCLFFNPQLASDSGKDRVDKRYIGYSVFTPEQRDHTHLSTEISEQFDLFITEHLDIRIAETGGWQGRINFNKFFVEINNFDTYKLRDNFLLMILRKIVRFVKKKRQKQ